MYVPEDALDCCSMQWLLKLCSRLGLKLCMLIHLSVLSLADCTLDRDANHHHTPYNHAAYTTDSGQPLLPRLLTVQRCRSIIVAMEGIEGPGAGSTIARLEPPTSN